VIFTAQIYSEKYSLCYNSDVYCMKLLHYAEWRFSLHLLVMITTQFITTLHPRFKVVMLTTVVVSITKFDNYYHIVISKLVNITMCYSGAHYTVFTVNAIYEFEAGVLHRCTLLVLKPAKASYLCLKLMFQWVHSCLSQ